MKQTQRKFDSAVNRKVVPEALRKRDRPSGLAVKYDLPPHQTSQLKQELLEKSAKIFDQKRPSLSIEPKVDVGGLYAEIRALRMERDFLKKKYNEIET